VNLSTLLEEVDVVATRGDLDIAIRALCYDSRRAAAGDVFFALPGAREDGGAYARAARAAGCVAVVGSRGVAFEGGTGAEVAEPRRALAQAANRLFEHPSRHLRVVGVTGTNGKTTTTYLLESMFRAAGRSAGLAGTTGVRFAGRSRASAFTTPEAPELQALLREMLDARVEVVALEVSSHALVQRRCFGLECDVLVFTNLSHDHLDYHGNMDAYLDAKLMLFDGRNGATKKPVTAVVNADDAVASRVIAAARAAGHVVRTFGRAADTDLRLSAVRATPRGLEIDMMERGSMPHSLSLGMLGSYNASNAAGAWLAARALGVEHADITRGMAETAGVPGRLERVAAGRPFEVVVDYAHTPDALERSLAAVREHFAGRVLLVFGCGGDRDRAKRPVMGRFAASGADIAWVTNDNPRSERPEAIAAEIVAGAAGAPLRVELDRRAAIAAAIDEARAGDVVLIAGKGHETTQTLGDRVLPFDDRDVARELLPAHGRRD
jgi:UDP-N-acetylmuramoyl-L-alanyl-D-glutamate--2,6-diaminopimelate ligase